MVTELDIYHSAQMMIDQHSEDAGVKAAMRSEELLKQGDKIGAQLWMQIIQAIATIELRNVQGTTH
jgi:hypothetical protein